MTQIHVVLEIVKDYDASGARAVYASANIELANQFVAEMTQRLERANQARREIESEVSRWVFANPSPRASTMQAGELHTWFEARMKHQLELTEKYPVQIQEDLKYHRHTEWVIDQIELCS